MRTTYHRVAWAVVVVVIVVLLQNKAFAVNELYTFSAGVDTTTWEVMYDTALYDVDDTQGAIRISKPVGGTHALQMLHIRFRPVVVGDFDVSIDFRHAQIDRVDGRPGNQVQLNAAFGGQSLHVVRSDEIEVGHNYHVWEDPPAVWRGEQPDTSTSGTLRMLRVGSLIFSYYNGTIVYVADYNTANVTFLSFSLQNNGTTDATSVSFDNFRIMADALVYPTAASAEDAPPPPAWLGIAPNPFVKGTYIQYSLDLGGNVVLSVFDARGRRITQLVRGHRTPGTYSIFWEGSDWRGEEVTSGVYFARLVVGRHVLTRKMTLLR